MNESRHTNDAGRLRQAVATSVTSRLFTRSSLCGVVLLASLVVCAGCVDFLSARDRDIQDATQAIQTAGDSGKRAKAYSARGVAYSEKARFGWISKQISNDEYKRLFDLAIQDHNQAVALNPEDAQVYFNRAHAYYDRGCQDLIYNPQPWIVPPSSKSWLDAAALDFEKAAEMDPKNDMALDLLGLAYEQAGEEDKAVRAYTQEMALNPLGKQRLADAYCFFGFRHQQQKEYVSAAAAYQKSIEFGVADDKSCPYEPVASMVGIYVETREYDQAWKAVHQAQKAGRWIAPELIERLKKQSGRAY